MAATTDQISYIIDLAVAKTKEYKEVKELLVSTGIVSADSQTVLEATTINELLNALTPQQASKLIDALIAKETPARGKSYSDKRITKVMDLLDEIKADIEAWDFNS